MFRAVAVSLESLTRRQITGLALSLAATIGLPPCRTVFRQTVSKHRANDLIYCYAATSSFKRDAGVAQPLSFVGFRTPVLSTRGVTAERKCALVPRRMTLRASFVLKWANLSLMPWCMRLEESAYELIVPESPICRGT
jgi:hypothetical protein